MAKNQFANTLAAVEAREKNLITADSGLWAIGAALIRDIKPLIEPSGRSKGKGKKKFSPNGIGDLLKLASASLVAHGYRAYKPVYLRQIMETTEAFPPAQRHKNLPFSHHTQAQNPKLLDWIVKNARKEDKEEGTVTWRFVREMVSRWYLRLKEKSDRAHEAALDKGKNAKTQAEKDAADKEIDETRAPPKKRTMVPPTGDESVTVLTELSVLKNAREAKRLAEATKAEIYDAVQQMDDPALEVLSETCLAASDLWREVGKVLREARTNKRGHLRAVGE